MRMMNGVVTEDTRTSDLYWMEYKRRVKRADLEEEYGVDFWDLVEYVREHEGE